MQRRLLTLTTDFGTGSTYVAIMKAVLSSIAPDIEIVDLTHEIPPQDVRAAALFLRDTVPYFPTTAIHVAVVDPGVGSDRSALLVESSESVIVAPDNGLWTLAVPNPERVWVLDQPRFWRAPISATFHGRDIFAPVAGHLATGIAPSDFGTPTATWKRIETPRPNLVGKSRVGEVLRVDRFGNLLTNLTAVDGTYHLHVAGTGVELVRTFTDRPTGTLIALLSSNGYIEIAAVNGSAAATLGVGIGTTVELRPGLVS